MENTRSAETELESRFREHEPELTPKRVQLLRSLIAHPEENYYLSSVELARRHGVNTATLVRTLQALGYPTFADFAADFREHFLSRVTPRMIIRASAAKTGESLEDRVRRDMQRDLENLEVVVSNVQLDTLLITARRIREARRVAVIGADAAYFLAGLLAYILRVEGIDADAPLGHSGTVRSRVRLMEPGDLLIGISFGRCLRETVEAIRAARAREVFTVGITDGHATPVARYSDMHLVASGSSPIFLGSYTAPVAIINAIVWAVAHLDAQRTFALLRRTEREDQSSSRWFDDKQEPQSATSAVDLHASNGA